MKFKPAGEGRNAKLSKLKALAPERQHKGFTLIEVLIAMTLLGIMMVLLFSSLKICADSWEKGESKITDVDDVAVVYNFFQRHLSVALPIWNDLSEEERSFSFQGKAQSLQFVSTFPASAGRSGLQLFSLYQQKEDNEQVIRVTLTPFIPAAKGEVWHKEDVTLITGVSEFTLAYFGMESGVSEGDWTTEWLDKDYLPRLVRINIKLDNGIFWPEMIVDLKVTGVMDNTDLETGSTYSTDNSENTNEPTKNFENIDDPEASK